LGQQLVSCLQVSWLALIHLPLQANQLQKDHRPWAAIVHHEPLVRHQATPRLEDKTQMFALSPVH
jgi:hypothetical protein